MKIKPLYFKNFIFIFSILFLFANTSPIGAEEKATQRSPSSEEWMICVAKVIDEFDDPVKECKQWMYYSQAEYKNCEKRAKENREASDKEIERRCGDAPKRKIPSPTPTEQPTQNQSSNNNQSEIPNYTQALVIKPPKESNFQKVKPSDFKIVYPESTSSATPKPATESANITGRIFIGKVDGDGTLILQLPDGREIELKDDKTAIEIKRPNIFKWRGGNVPLRKYTAPKRHISVNEVDCHILLELERRDKEIMQRLGGITFASDWSLDDRVDIKSIGDCSYLNEGGPIRVSAEQGQVTFKTLGDVMVTANEADFGIGYDAKSGTSVVEIYNGSVTVTNKSGQSKKISTVYGSQVNQVEVNKDGVMSGKIAIPLSEWEAFLASQQKKEQEASAKSSFPIIPAIAVLGIGGLIFFLYRTGKLIPLYKTLGQKVSGMTKKISKNNKQQDSA